MTLFVLVLAALATWQATEVWHRGAIFSGSRAWVQAWPDGGIRGFVKDLLGCPFCLSIWVGIATAAVLVPDLPTGEEWYHWVAYVALGALKLFCYGLAVSRLANAGHDLTKNYDSIPHSPLEGLSSWPMGAPPSAAFNFDIEAKETNERPTIPFPERADPPAS